jgi:hypothetical protein
MVTVPSWLVINNVQVQRILLMVVPDVVDYAIPPQTLYQFIDYAFEGNLLGGRQSSLPLLKEEEVELLSVPLAQWAPAPFDELSSTITQRFITLCNREENYMNAVAKMFLLKTRIWQGMIPLAGQRWRELRLDDPANWLEAHDFLNQTVQIFEYLWHPSMESRRRKMFNLVSAECAIFQEALNARRHSKKIEGQIDLVRLWREFMQHKFAVMVDRTHAWVISRCHELQDKIKADFENFALQHESFPSKAQIFINGCQDLNKLISRADFKIYMSMDGFLDGFEAAETPGSQNSFWKEAEKFSKWAQGSPFIAPREQKYYEMTEEQSWKWISSLTLTPFSKQFEPENRETLLGVFNEGRHNRDSIRKEFRSAPSPLGEERWIAILQSRINWSISHGGPRNQTWGFVAYRLSYTETTEEWKRFTELLEKDFKNAGEWIDGAEEVKHLAGLQWLDGRELNIPENDVFAAKRYVNSIVDKAKLIKVLDTFFSLQKAMISGGGCGRETSSRSILNASNPT